MKTITSFLSKAVLAIAGVVAFSSSAYAQTQATAVRWTGTAYGSIGSQTFYLYNIGAGKFVKADAEWGIQAVLKFQGFGTGLTLEGSSNGGYVINTGVSTTSTGTQSKYLGINLPGKTEGSSSTKWNDSEKTFGLICDATKSGTASSSYSRALTFETVTGYDGATVYRIKETITTGSSSSTKTSYYWGAKYGIDYSTGKASANTGDVATFCNASNSSVNDTINGDYKDYYSWILVPESELSDSHISDVSKGGGLTANMSYLLKDPYFDRNRTEFESAWKVYSTGETSSTYRYDWLSSKTTTDSPWSTPVLQKITVNNKENGKYSFASIEGQGVMYTTFEAPAEGYYEVELRGFSQGDNDAWLYVSTDPTVGPANIGTKIALPKIADGTFSKTNLTNEELAAPGKLLYENEDNKYTISMQVHATKDQTVYIGIYKAAATQSSRQSTSSSHNYYYDTDYIGIDNVQLYYVGQIPFVLDEEFTSDDYMRSADYQGETYATVYLKRDFTLNKWNTLVMPIDMTSAQVKEAFGEGTQLAELKGVGSVTGRPSIDFATVSLDKDATVIEKSKMYLIKPVNDGAAKTLVVTNADKTTKVYENVKMYTIGRRNLNGSQLVDPTETKGECDQYPDGQVKFVGTYVAKEEGPKEGNYVFSGGNMYHLTKAMSIKGFRGWFEDMTEANSIKFNISDGEITSIDEVISNDKGKTSGAVYTVDGVQVRANASSLDDLPAGIYIFNGKKHLVK